jgi:hypothetical protein
MQTANVAAAYDRWASIYDLVFGGVFAHRRRQAVIVAEKAGGRVLEVGKAEREPDRAKPRRAAFLQERARADNPAAR